MFEMAEKLPNRTNEGVRSSGDEVAITAGTTFNPAGGDEVAITTGTRRW